MHITQKDSFLTIMSRINRCALLQMTDAEEITEFLLVIIKTPPDQEVP